jgi:glycosyltransferase involved in cell wall biosynthesis
MKNGKRIFAIVPAYNEEKSIKDVVFRLRKSGISPIVVDDHSSDRTATLAKKSGAVVIVQKSNTGKGQAMRAGIDYVLKNHPKAEFMVFIDADMQYMPEDARKMVDILKSAKADIATGCRNWNAVPFRHKLGNFVWRSTFNTLFGTKLRDTNCGLMALRKDAVEKIKDSIKGGYIMENSMFIEALKKKLKIKQVEVSVSYKKISTVKHGMKTVGGVLLFIIKEGVSYRIKGK